MSISTYHQLIIASIVEVIDRYDACPCYRACQVKHSVGSASAFTGSRISCNTAEMNL